jgi:hypothetical protein
MKKLITKPNEWYDNLSDNKRDLFFLVFVFGSLILTQYLTYVENFIWSFPIWVCFWSILRIPYFLIRYINNKK